MFKRIDTQVPNCHLFEIFMFHKSIQIKSKEILFAMY